MKTERKDPRKEFLKTFNQLTYGHNAWQVWNDFITMFACSISNSVDRANYDDRESLYLSIIKKYNKSELNLFPELAAHTVMALEDNSEQDFLGTIFMELNLGNNSECQFFTPYHICEFMARIVMTDVVDEVNKEGYFTLNDPACGAGATLIAGINETKEQLEKIGLNYQNHILVIAQDIDQTVALMCYIQLSLLGVAGFIKVGNTLTDPMTSKDDTKKYWFTPMYFSNVWVTRRIFHTIGSDCDKKVKENRVNEENTAITKLEPSKSKTYTGIEKVLDVMTKDYSTQKIKPIGEFFGWGRKINKDKT